MSVVTFAGVRLLISTGKFCIWLRNKLFQILFSRELLTYLYLFFFLHSVYLSRYLLNHCPLIIEDHASAKRHTPENEHRDGQQVDSMTLALSINDPHSDLSEDK